MEFLRYFKKNYFLKFSWVFLLLLLNFTTEWIGNFWLLPLSGLLYFGYRKSKSWILNLLILLVIFVVGLYLHSLLNVSLVSVNLDKERMNLFNYVYDGQLQRYLREGVVVRPYILREFVYGKDLKILLVWDSFLKMSSLYNLIKVLGFSGLFVLIAFIREVKTKDILWLGVVLLSSSMAVLTDTKKSYLLALPLLIVFGFSRVEKLKGKVLFIYLLLFILDLIVW